MKNTNILLVLVSIVLGVFAVLILFADFYSIKLRVFMFLVLLFVNPLPDIIRKRMKDKKAKKEDE